MVHRRRSATLRESVHVIRELANGRSVEYKGSDFHFPGRPELLEVGPGYGPKALSLTGESATVSFCNSPTCRSPSGPQGRARCRRAGGRDPSDVTICAARRRTSPTAPRKASPMAATSVAGSGDGGQPRGRHRRSLWRPRRRCAAGAADYIRGRERYDYNEHGQAGNVHTQFVPDDIVDRFCIVGPVSEHIDRMVALKNIGVDQFREEQWFLLCLRLPRPKLRIAGRKLFAILRLQSDHFAVWRWRSHPSRCSRARGFRVAETVCSAVL